MIKLENIAIDDLHARYYAPEIQNKIERKRLKTIQDLVDEMERYPTADWKDILPELESTKKIAEKYSKKGTEPDLYSIKGYEDSTLTRTDYLNTGSTLLIFSPTTERCCRTTRLDNMKISDIKRLLTTCTSSGENFLLYSYKKIGRTTIPKIVNAVDFYTEQVERQAELTPTRGKNVFTFQQGKKVKLVEEMYPEIIEYMMNNTKEFIWGELSDFQRSQYLSSIKNNRAIDQIIRNRMVQTLANYTTLPELKEISQGNYEGIKRLIKR